MIILSKLAIFGGHNGTSESGASGNGLTEKAVAKEAAQIATAYAKACGHSVVNGFGKSLSERIKYANSENVVAVLELHTNAGGGQGAETLYCEGVASAKEDAISVAKAGSIKGLKNRGAKGDTTTRHGRLGIVRDTKAPALLHELFFIDSASDVAIWKNNKKEIVESITKEWLKRRGLNAIPKTTSKPATTKGIKTNVHETEFKNTKLYFAYDNEKNSYAKVLFRLSTSNSEYDEIPLYPGSVDGYYIIQAKTDIQLYSDSNLTKKYSRKIAKGDQAISRHLKNINK